MPLYEYRCTKCHALLEVIQGFRDKPLRKCEACGGKLEKLISRSGFVLKGGGWYQTDYKSAPKESRREESESSPVATGGKDAGSVKASTDGAAASGSSAETAKPAAEAPSEKRGGARGGSRKGARRR